MKQNPKVTVGVILYRAEKYLPYSLTSLINQDYPNIEFLFKDQSPNGEAYDFIKKHLPEVFQKAHVFKGENRWHSGGQNDLINQMSGDYYLCASYDMFYPRNLISQLVNEMSKQERQSYGSATVKLLGWDFSKASKGPIENSYTDRIDSLGIGIKSNHHFYDIGQGEVDEGQYHHLKSIFGSSGAFTFFRKSALDEISYTNSKGIKEYYDELIHYKNDVDLAYRLQWAGQKCLLLPKIKVYHDRQAKNWSKGSFLLKIIKGRKGKDRWVRENSFFGQQVVLLKNFRKGFSLKVKIKSIAYQWMALGYLSIFEPYLWKQFKKLKNHRFELESKRQAMKVGVKAKEIEKYMN